MINFNDRDGAVAIFVVGTGESWWKRDQAFAIQGQQQFATCHILEMAVRLEPLPAAAKDLGDMFSALTPMCINCGLDLNDIGGGDSPFSDRNG